MDNNKAPFTAFVAPGYEKRVWFVAWATEPFMAGLRQGTPARYAVIRNTPCPGLVWALVYGEGSEAHEVKRSDGAFYNGAPDHPEGAIEWAKASARAEKARIEGERECFVAWATEPFAHTRTIRPSLPHDQSFYSHVHAVFIAYYFAIEATQRALPHWPTRSAKEVAAKPTLERAQMMKAIDERRNPRSAKEVVAKPTLERAQMMKAIDARCNHLLSMPIPSRIYEDAKHAALSEFQASLKPCECSVCATQWRMVDDLSSQTSPNESARLAAHKWWASSVVRPTLGGVRVFVTDQQKKKRKP